MKKKTLSLGIVGILALALLINFASAAITISDSTPTNPSVYGNSFTIKVTSDNVADGLVTLALGSITESGNTMSFTTNLTNNQIDFSNPFITNVPQLVQVNYNPSNMNFNYMKTYSTTITASNSTGQLSTKTVTFLKRPYCDNVSTSLPSGSLKAEVTDIKTVSGFGDNDNYWYPMDQVQIEVTIDNQVGYDIKSIQVNWALYTTYGDKVADGKLSTFRLKDGNEKAITFNITLDKHLKYFENGDAVLLVKADGKVDDSSSNYNNNETCGYDSKQVNTITGDDFVILRDMLLNGEQIGNKELTLNTPLTCGEDVTVNSDVWNIQSSDQNTVTVEIYNKKLGIDQTVNVGDINAFSKDSINTQFTIPENANEEWYSVLFSVYNEDHNVFENSESGKAEFMVKLKVQNCTARLVPKLSAQLVSEAIAGKELIIKTTITNQASTTLTYNLNVANYADWTAFKNMSETSVTLAAGESKDIQIVFMPNKNAVGDKIFDFEVVTNNQLVAKQPVKVSLSAAKTGKFSDFIVSNWKLLGIILLNLILVIAIIVVIVRLYRR